MLFRVTSVAAEETGALLRYSTVRIEDCLNEFLRNENFGEGVDQFILVFISVDDKANENSRWGKSHDKTGSYTNPSNGEKVRYISSAVLVPPESFVGKGPAALLSYVCSSAIARLVMRPKRVPKGFDYGRCSAAVSMALAAHIDPVKHHPVE